MKRIVTNNHQISSCRACQTSAGVAMDTAGRGPGARPVCSERLGTVALLKALELIWIIMVTIPVR